MNHDMRKKKFCTVAWLLSQWRNSATTEDRVSWILTGEQLRLSVCLSLKSAGTVLLLGGERYKWVLGPTMSTEFQ